MPSDSAHVGPLIGITADGLKQLIADEATRLLNERTILPSEEMASFYKKTNALKQALIGGQAAPLLAGVVKSLRKHCEPLLPMASGKYKSHGNICVTPIVSPGHGHLSFELGHEGGHVAAHGIDYLLHELHQFDILHLAGSILNVIPFLAGVGCCLVKIYEVWTEHHLIEKIKKQLDKLNNFSNADREALYEFVIARTLLSLKTELSLCHTPTAWHFLLLSQSLASLSEISKEFKSLEQFGMEWSQSIIDQFKVYGVYMATELVRYDPSAVSVPYEIQMVFADDHRVSTDKETKKEYESLKLKNDRLLKSRLQKGLYKILEAYEHRVSVPVFLSVPFAAYFPSQLKTLRKYFRQFNYALTLISQKADLINRSPNAREQWEIIDACLKGRLDEMATQMPYSIEVSALSAETSRLRMVSMSVPLILLGSGELAFQDPAVLAKIRIEELEQENLHLTSQVTTVQAERDELSGQNAELGRANTELGRANAKLSRENAELGREKAELEVKNRDAEGIIQALTTSNETQDRLIKTLMKVNDDQKANYRRFEAYMAQQTAGDRSQGLGFFDQTPAPVPQAGQTSQAALGA